MKERLGEEHIGRIRKFLKTKLNSVNTISAINSRAVAVIKYSAGVIKWTKEELQNLDRKTRELLTIYWAFHPRGDKDSLCSSRRNGGRGLIRVKDCVNMEISKLRRYASESNEKLVKAVWKEKLSGERKEKKPISNEQTYRNKVLHGKFVTVTEEGARDLGNG